MEFVKHGWLHKKSIVKLHLDEDPAFMIDLLIPKVPK